MHRSRSCESSSHPEAKVVPANGLAMTSACRHEGLKQRGETERENERECAIITSNIGRDIQRSDVSMVVPNACFMLLLRTHKGDTTNHTLSHYNSPPPTSPLVCKRLVCAIRYLSLLWSLTYSYSSYPCCTAVKARTVASMSLHAITPKPSLA